MKEEEIRELLTEQGIDYAAHGSICATIKASVGAYKNGIGDVMHTMKDHILHINAKGIAILAIDDINGIPQADTLQFISREQILSTDIRIRLFHFLFTIETEQGCIQYKLRRNVLASPWHKENLSLLLLQASSAGL